MKRLSKKSLAMLDEFDVRCQNYGWQRDEITEDGFLFDEYKYLESRKEIKKYLLELENKILVLKNNK